MDEFEKHLKDQSDKGKALIQKTLGLEGDESPFDSLNNVMDTYEMIQKMYSQDPKDKEYIEQKLEKIKDEWKSDKMKQKSEKVAREIFGEETAE